MRKGIFIPDITVEMFKNASLEAVEELMVSGTMEDIEIPDRPRGEWKKKPENYDYFYCSGCGYAYKHAFNFCPNCGSDNRKEGGEK